LKKDGKGNALKTANYFKERMALGSGQAGCPLIRDLEAKSSFFLMLK
jgi:hypothetical protein